MVRNNFIYTYGLPKLFFKMNNFDFIIQHNCKQTSARVGKLITPHGIIETPAFIFCGTKAAVKNMPTTELVNCNTQIILSNTYHLMLQPGAEVIAKFGGLHQFIGWNGPMLTDSGGFQIFSLGYGSIADEIKGKRNNNRAKTLLKITEHGATFRSYIDGTIYTLTPEKSMKVQEKLGADLVLVFDECTPFNVDPNYTKTSMERSHRWALRSLEQFNKHDNGKQALYGIIQGGIYKDLRNESCDFNNNLVLFGQAIGGSLGASKTQMYDIVAYTKSKLNPLRPTHLLGIGGVEDIFWGVSQGIDTFDCVHPTRLARHGGALVKKNISINNKNHINLNNSIYKLDENPIDDTCLCITCKKHTKGYLHHLLKAKELLASHLITIHNITFMNLLMTAIRNAILTDQLMLEKNLWIN